MHFNGACVADNAINILVPSTSILAFVSRELERYLMLNNCKLFQLKSLSLVAQDSKNFKSRLWFDPIPELNFETDIFIINLTRIFRFSSLVYFSFGNFLDWIKNSTPNSFWLFVMWLGCDAIWKFISTEN